MTAAGRGSRPVFGNFVLDSFALLAVFRDEPAADAVLDLLQQARLGEISLVMSVINLGEVIYHTIRERGTERAQGVLADFERYPIEVIDIDRELALAGAELKGLHRISYADCIAAALAERLDATLVTGDRDFRHVEDRVAIEWLAPADADAP